MPQRRHILGLLGAVAAGKSHIARRLVEMGPGAILEADALAHAALEAAARDGRLAAALGPQALDPEGRPDRSALRARAQADPQVLRTLEGLTHPGVRRAVEEAVARHRGGAGPRLLILDIPLLLETGLDRLCDALWLVEVPDAVRRARAHARGLSPDDLRHWERAQAPLEAKRRVATRVVANDVSPADLDRQLREGLAQLDAR